MTSNNPLYTIKGVLILNTDCDRLAVRYYSNELNTFQQQRDYEKLLIQKTDRVNGDIAIIDPYTVVYRQYSNVIFYILGAKSENEMLLYNVLDSMIESISNLLNAPIDYKEIIENLDSVFLVIDEMIDDGILLEASDELICTRCRLTNEYQQATDQKVQSFLDIAKKSLIRAFV